MFHSPLPRPVSDPAAAPDARSIGAILAALGAVPPLPAPRRGGDPAPALRARGG
jgi:hypothetical protein